MKYTKHAKQRATERSVDADDIQAALDWGTEIPQGRGRVALVVDKRAIKRAEVAQVDLGPHDGVAVVLADNGEIITVIRSDDIKRLARFGAHDFYRGKK